MRLSIGGASGGKSGTQGASQPKSLVLSGPSALGTRPSTASVRVVESHPKKGLDALGAESGT